MSPHCQELGQLAQKEGAYCRVLGVVHHVHVDHVHGGLADRVPGVETFQNLIITRADGDTCDLCCAYCHHYPHLIIDLLLHREDDFVFFLALLELFWTFLSKHVWARDSGNQHHGSFFLTLILLFRSMICSIPFLVYSS